MFIFFIQKKLRDRHRLVTLVFMQYDSIKARVREISCLLAIKRSEE